MVIPCKVSVEDYGSPETPSWVNASSCDGNGGQVDQEHSKPDGKRGQNLQLYHEKRAHWNKHYPNIK